MLPEHLQSLIDNATPLDGNAIEDGERIRFGVMAGADAGARVESVDWSDSLIDRCRFIGTTIAHSSFERVVFRDCDFSGLTFQNCRLHACLFLGIRSRSHLALDGCLLDSLTLARCRADRLEIHDCRIGSMHCIEVTAERLLFHRSSSRKGQGRVTITDSELAMAGGLDTLKDSGVRVAVDAALWRDLGDRLLRERGFEQLDRPFGHSTESLDQLTDVLDRRRP